LITINQTFNSRNDHNNDTQKHSQKYQTCTTVSESCLIKKNFLPHISLEKYINILSSEMASVENQHCVNCIGTLYRSLRNSAKLTETPRQRRMVFSHAAHTGWQKNCTPQLWPQSCQVLTDFKNSFTVTFCSKFAAKERSRHSSCVSPQHLVKHYMSAKQAITTNYKVV